MTKSTSQLAREARRSSGEEIEVEEARPTARSECVSGPRPCPWVGCRHHLYLDVNPDNGSIKFNFPDLEPWQLSPCCSLDVTDEEGATLDEVGAYMNLSRERIRQIEVLTLKKLKPSVQRLLEDKARKNRRRDGGDGPGDR
jgi:hypothetical protein